MKICIVKLSAMGDIIHTMVALQFVKNRYPNSTIDWIVEESFKDILSYNPHINNILSVNLKAIKKDKSKIMEQIRLLQEYRKNDYDVIIDAQGLLKSALVSRFVKNKKIDSYIVGFDKDSIREPIASKFYDKYIKIPYSANVIKRNLKVICDPLKVIINDKMVLEKQPFLFISKQNSKKDYVVFVIGASTKNKIYPKEKFLKLSKYIDKDILIIWGNDEEYATAKWLKEKNNKLNIDTKGDINHLKSIIQNASIVIGGDTGPTHMAWALNVPSIILFGNTPYKRNTYLTNINKILTSKSDINPLKIDKDDFSIHFIQIYQILHLYKNILTQNG